MPDFARRTPVEVVRTRTQIEDELRRPELERARQAITGRSA